MKVILLQDVPKIGKKHDVREVPNGLARNFLIPQKFVEMATATSLKKLELLKEKNKKNEEEKNKILTDALSSLTGKKVTIMARATEEGGLFAKITESDISKAIKKEFNVDIPKELIAVDEPFKKVGQYKITIMAGDKKEELTIVIEEKK